MATATTLELKVGQWYEDGREQRIKIIAGKIAHGVDDLAYPMIGIDSDGCIETYTHDGRFNIIASEKSLVEHLPNCTGFDWTQPPAEFVPPVAVPKQYPATHKCEFCRKELPTLARWGLAFHDSMCELNPIKSLTAERDAALAEVERLQYAFDSCHEACNGHYLKVFELQSSLEKVQAELSACRDGYRLWNSNCLDARTERDQLREQVVKLTAGQSPNVGDMELTEEQEPTDKEKMKSLARSVAEIYRVLNNQNRILKQLLSATAAEKTAVGVE